ncbi:MAG: hypothetical protein ABI675_21030 [Chitinophagaceae bacterium]
MIAIIRVRFNNTLPSDIWSDDVMHNWMNPNIPYSLAHYWTRTSLFQADMRYHLFPPIAMDDPRPPGATNNIRRDLLVNSVINELTLAVNPDWNIFDRLFIWFAQQTDLFGGGGYRLPNEKYVPAAVCDIHSLFSHVCHEVGHMFGFSHEKDYASGNEYTSPYSIMSAETYGGAGSSFLLPLSERLSGVNLPIGSPVPGSSGTGDPQLIIGPYITPVQLYIHATGQFVDNRTVYQVPNSYATLPNTFYLTAVDEAINKWPFRKVMLAVLPPLVENGDTYFIELRRNNSYDSGFSLDGRDFAPIAVVVHSADPITKRISYTSCLPLLSSRGDRDYHCFRGHFTIRLNSINDNYSGCSLTVGGDNFWRNFGLKLENITNTKLIDRISEWATIDISPCYLYGKSPHQFRYYFYTSTIMIKASSFGYEKPHYQWFIDNQPINQGSPLVPVTGLKQFEVNVRVPENGELSQPQKRMVYIIYNLTGVTLMLTCNDKYSDIHTTVNVVVNETSPEVIQSNYPDSSAWTDIDFDNVTVEWDKAYQDAVWKCTNQRLKEKLETYKTKRELPFQIDGPRPEWITNTVDLLNELVVSNPSVANFVINEIARLNKVSRLEILKWL